MARSFAILGIVSLMLAAVAPADAAVEYSVAYMGNFSPNAINNNGEVVGVSYDANTGYAAALLYSNGQLSNLGSLGGTYSSANGINDSSQIVGISESADDGALHAFLYENGRMSDLGTFGGVSSTVYGINNSAQIVGFYDTADGGRHAILYDHGAITDLGNLGGSATVAAAINSSGVIAGGGTTMRGDTHLFVYEKGAMTDLGISCAEGFTTGINDAGQVVGDWWTSDAGLHVFLYKNGGIVDIDSFPNDTFADSINNNGDIVGYSMNQAFIYSNGVFSNLNDLIDQPGTVLSDACKINDLGQIAASGYSDQYGYGAYLLTPVPEPPTVVFTLTVLIPLLLFVARRFISRKSHTV